MFDPIVQRKLELAQAAAQLAADGDVPPCAAARLAVAKELSARADAVYQRALRAPSLAAKEREQGYAQELRRTAAQLEHEARECTATA